MGALCETFRCRFLYVIDDMRSPQEIISGQATAVWSAVKQKSVWLPALFIFLWHATPSSESAFFYFLTNDIGEEVASVSSCLRV